MSKYNIWWHNKKVNPLTNRRIKKNGKVYKSLLKECLINNHIIDNYKNYHMNKIDPLIRISLPLVVNKKLFKYKYCWDPLSGDILGIDPRGPLYFDPDTLIHYFYTNRLKYLWNEGDAIFTGNYGDGLGNGPHFNIAGRGISLHYYLFRLPIPDAYCDNINTQQITIGPILTIDDIVNIYNLAVDYEDNYKNNFGIERPNIIKIYKIYNEAIKQNAIDIELQNTLSLTDDEIQNNKYLANKLAVDRLKQI